MDYAITHNETEINEWITRHFEERAKEQDGDLRIVVSFDPGKQGKYHCLTRINGAWERTHSNIDTIDATRLTRGYEVYKDQSLQCGYYHKTPAPTLVTRVCRHCGTAYKDNLHKTTQLRLAYCCLTCANQDGMPREEALKQGEEAVIFMGFTKPEEGTSND